MEIKELINKIRWDKRENPEEYSLFCIDRISGKLVELRYSDIKRIEGNFLILEVNGREKEIPLHRIRELRKSGKLIWSR